MTQTSGVPAKVRYSILAAVFVNVVINYMDRSNISVAGLMITKELAGTTNFFITWFPQYLVDFKKMDFIKSGMYASVPFMCAFLGVLLSGFLSDYLVRKKVSSGIARKAPIIFGMFLGVSIVCANYTSDPFWVIVFMSLAFFGNGLASDYLGICIAFGPKKFDWTHWRDFQFYGRPGGHCRACCDRVSRQRRGFYVGSGVCGLYGFCGMFELCIFSW